jgi:hypothetical protein
MNNTFDQNISNGISKFLVDRGFTATENLLYYYKKLSGGVITFVIQKIEDSDPNDLHQKFDAYFGLSSYKLDTIKKNNYEPYMDGHLPETCIYLTQIKNFNGMALEVKSNTDWDRFGERLTENMDRALQQLEGIETDDEILEFMLLRDSHMVNVHDNGESPIYYEFGMRLYQYVRMNKKYDLIEKYIRNCNVVNQRLSENKIDEAGIQKIISKACRSTRQIQQNNFTPLQLPESLGKLCDWIDDNNYYKTISGLFEMNDNGKSTMSHWIEDEKVAERFGVFGSLPNGDMVCYWQQDDGRMPVVIIGEGGRSDVIAKDMDDFIALLAIGYYEFWSADISIGPKWDSQDQEAEFNNKEFQLFYKSTFGKEILKDGSSIIEGLKSCDNLREWLLKNYQPWNEM